MVSDGGQRATGKMVFTVLGAVVELERSLIAERVKAGLRNARAKGKRLGRPRVAGDATRIAILRAHGFRGGRSCRKRESARGQPSARFLACPKSYRDVEKVGRAEAILAPVSA